jgi:hypothetical protein
MKGPMMGTSSFPHLSESLGISPSTFLR